MPASPALMQAVALARAEAAERGIPLRVDTLQPLAPPVPYVPADCPPSAESLQITVDFFSPFVIVYPSGLALDADQINWFWRFPVKGRPDRYRYYQGPAIDAAQFAYARRVSLDDVFGVHGDDIHGTCVLERRGNDWRLVQAESFPA